MADDDQSPTGHEKVGTDDRDVALDSLARFEGGCHSIANVDRQVVTLPRWRPLHDLVSLLLRRRHSPSPAGSGEGPHRLTV